MRLPIEDAVELLKAEGYSIPKYPKGIDIEISDTFTPDELYEMVMASIEKGNNKSFEFTHIPKELIQRFRYKPETISRKGWNKIIRENVMAYEKYSKIAKRFKTPEEFIDYVLSTVEYSPHTKRRIEKLREETSTPYFEFFRIHGFIATNIIERDWNNNITPARVRRAMILSVGRNFPDGFSGIIIKAGSYENKWIVDIEDGERGSVFYKVYTEFPTKKQLIYDTMLLLPSYITIKDFYPDLDKQKTTEAIP